jgi:hypothetical protein
MRCKLYLLDISDSRLERNAKVLMFGPLYDPDTPMDERLMVLATPAGHIELHADNPTLLAQLEVGQAYHIDFRPAEAPQSLLDRKGAERPEAA